MQNKKENSIDKLKLLCENIQNGKYNNSFIKIKINKFGKIVYFTREIYENLEIDNEVKNTK